MTKEEYVKENYSPTKCKVIVTDDKQHLAISFDGNTHCLIFANIARGGKTWPLLKISIKEVDVNNENINDLDFEDFVEEDEIDVTEPTKKLNYPFDEQIQEKLMILDASDFNNLTTFISSPTADQKCCHGNFWNQDDPRGYNWIFSNNIKIAHSTYVSKKERKLYYRKTLASCKCRLLYNGSDDLFVAVQSRGISKQNNSGTRLGYTVNLGKSSKKKIFFFRALPELHIPPPPFPNLDNLVVLFRMSKKLFCPYDRIKF